MVFPFAFSFFLGRSIFMMCLGRVSFIWFELVVGGVVECVTYLYTIGGSLNVGRYVVLKFLYIEILDVGYSIEVEHY